MARSNVARHAGGPRALEFRIHMLPRLRAASGADNIQVPALRESEVINLAFVEQLEAYAEQNGTINTEAGREMHEEFLGMSRLEMANLVRRLLEDFVECFTEPVDRAEANAYYTLCATFDTLLYLVARGNISFGKDSGIVFCKPESGSPTPTVQRKILARLRSDRPIHFLALEIYTELDVRDPDRDAGRPVKSPTPRTNPRTVDYPTDGYALDIERDHLRIRTTDYHAGDLVLFWDEVFDMARGLGLDIPHGAPS
jgi:hypothetical protein